MNRRENTQLDLRLRQLERQETIIQRSYDREIYWKRLQLAQIYAAFNESLDDVTKTTRVQTPLSFYAIKMRRNQSAPPNTKRTETTEKIQLRPSTTPTAIQRTKRTMSVFRDITLKAPNRTLGNMLVLLENEKKYHQNEWPLRSRTMVNLKKGS